MKKLSVFFLAAALLAQAASGLELKNGRIRLVIDERSGRFALYYLEDVAKNRYVPLLYAEETRTTYPTLMVDQKTYKLGDAPEFRVAVSRDASGAGRIEYKSSFCVVRQSFTFTTTPGATMADGVLMSFDIENVGQKDASLGLRVLLDTWLGEKSPAHFRAQSLGALTGETSLGGDFKDVWLRSQDESASAPGAASLQVLLGLQATRPDKVLAANWKRLNDAAWSFEASASRNFTLLPYSINDSALALYYEPLVVRPGSTRLVTVVLSLASDSYQTTEGASGARSVMAAPADTAPLDEMADFIAVRTLLEAINAALSSGVEPSEAQKEEFESILQRLENRKAKY